MQIRDALTFGEALFQYLMSLPAIASEANLLEEKVKEFEQKLSQAVAHDDLFKRVANLEAQLALKDKAYE